MPVAASALTPPALRNLIDEFVRSDSELEAFVLDHFPQVKRLYGCGMDRITKVNLLFEQADCDRIYENLCQRYPKAVSGEHKPADADGSTPPYTGEAAGKETRRFFLVLTGTIDELDEPKIKALVAHIRKVSGDAELTLESIKSGSIILHFKGSAEGLERLQGAYLSGELQNVLGYPLENIGVHARPLQTGMTSKYRKPKLIKQALVASAICLTPLIIALALRPSENRYRQQAVAVMAPTIAERPDMASETAKIVSFMIESVPAGAAVFDRDGQVLGRTPWTIQTPSAQGIRHLTLRLRGYADTNIDLNRSMSGQVDVRLRPYRLPLKGASSPSATYDTKHREPRQMRESKLFLDPDLFLDPKSLLEE